MRDVGTNVRRPRQAHLRIQVGTVHVDLAAVAVNNLADLADTFLVHTMGRGVGGHQAGQLAARLAGLALEVLQVDVALRVALDDHHPHARHLRRRGVGTVGGRRDQADIAMPLTAALVVAANGEQPGVLALGA